jgi:hypothetical protein
MFTTVYSVDIYIGLENIFLAAKCKNNIFLCNPNIPAYVDFRERMVPHTVINVTLGARQSRLAE